MEEFGLRTRPPVRAHALRLAILLLFCTSGMDEIMPRSALYADDTSLTDQSRSALEDFLNHDCDFIGKKGPYDAKQSTSYKTLIELLAVKPAVTPALERIVVNGLEKRERDRLEQIFAEEWKERQKFLKANKGIGLTPADAELLKQESREEYVRQAMEDVEFKRRQNAAIALVAIQHSYDSDKVVEVKDIGKVLKKVSAQDEKLRRVIQLAQKQFQVEGMAVRAH